MDGIYSGNSIFTLSQTLDNNKVTHINGKFINNEHVESHKKSFVTSLTGNHYPSVNDLGIVTEFAVRIRDAKSIKEIKELFDGLNKETNKLYSDIHNMREKYFDVVHANSDRVYGILTPGTLETDRDNYIKALITYQNIGAELEKLARDPAVDVLKIPEVKRLAGHHTGSIYGDLISLDHLKNGRQAELPDLTYNKGELQFG